MRRPTFKEEEKGAGSAFGLLAELASACGVVEGLCHAQRAIKTKEIGQKKKKRKIVRSLVRLVALADSLLRDCGNLRCQLRLWSCER